MNPRHRLVASRLRILAVAILGIGAHVQAQQPNIRAARIPLGFTKLDDEFWKGPWVFSGGKHQGPIIGLHQTMGGANNGPIPIRLDDGSTATLRVAARPCTNVEECEPNDCGCFERDSFWIDVTDSRGRSAAHLHLWAAYGDFDMIPIDLIDGVGDELLIVRLRQRAVPPPGPDLKIWKLGATKPADLIQRARDDSFAVAGRLGTVEGAIPCAGWRTRLFVNLDEPKPRPITRHAEFAAADWPDSGCHLNEQGAEGMTAVKRRQVLQFENGAYLLR